MGAATKLAFAVFLISCCSGGCGGGSYCQLWNYLLQKLLFPCCCLSSAEGCATVALEGPSADLTRIGTYSLILFMCSLLMLQIKYKISE